LRSIQGSKRLWKAVIARGGINASIIGVNITKETVMNKIHVLKFPSAIDGFLYGYLFTSVVFSK
jgi:hypothetical protein